jgi:hypothetical protein
MPSFRDAPLGAGPESILPVEEFSDEQEQDHGGYGFRARASRAPE